MSHKRFTSHDLLKAYDYALKFNHLDIALHLQKKLKSQGVEVDFPLVKLIQLINKVRKIE